MVRPNAYYAGLIARSFWLSRIEAAWQESPIAWLSGVRRTGKTTLAHDLGDERILFVNCDLPAAEDMVRDPALFYRNGHQPVVVSDEIHQLRDPSRVLKIGADLFPKLRILVTGSSTLAASRKFRDTLTGRKRQIHLTPVLTTELKAFGVPLPGRLLHGGLPPALLAETKKPSFYREWMDSLFARDIQRLFAFRHKNRSNSLFEYRLRQSAGQLEVTASSKTPARRRKSRRMSSRRWAQGLAVCPGRFPPARARGLGEPGCRAFTRSRREFFTPCLCAPTGGSGHGESTERGSWVSARSARTGLAALTRRSRLGPIRTGGRRRKRERGERKELLSKPGSSRRESAQILRKPERTHVRCYAFERTRALGTTVMAGFPD